jgi:hypothetical protein
MKTIEVEVVLVLNAVPLYDDTACVYLSTTCKQEIPLAKKSKRSVMSPTCISVTTFFLPHMLNFLDQLLIAECVHSF